MVASARRRKDFAIIGGAIGAGLVALVLALGAFPIPASFSLREAAILDPNFVCRPSIDTTKGSSVTFHWSAPSWVFFAVVSCAQNAVVYYSNGTNGSGTFTSVGGYYQFGSSCALGPCASANVSGTFTRPLLNLLPPGW